MTSLLMSLVLQTTLVGAMPQPAEATPARVLPQTFEAAYKTSVKNRRPLVVLLGADWCPGCVVMKKQVMPKVAKQGALAKVAYAYIDVDEQPKLAGQLLKGKSIPQLVRLEQQKKGWHVDHLIGAHKPKLVSNFVRHIGVHKRPARP